MKKKKKKFIYNKKYKYFFFNFNKIDFLYFLKKKYNLYIKEKYLWNIKDWGVSRQRYWGTPIPILKCKKCGYIKNNYNNIPLKLPKYLKPLLGVNSLKKNFFFSNYICFLCKKKSFIENNTLDTFFDSSWYFLNYFNLKKKKILNIWLPIDFYIGGIEHSILHLLYSRFIIKFLRDKKFLNFGEPIKKLFTLGMVLNITYYKKKNNIIKWLSEKEIKNKKFSIGKIEKMSKSKKNGVNPNEFIKKYSIDSLRLSVIYFIDLKKDFLWKNKYIINSYKILKKIWNFYIKNKNYIINKNIYKKNINYNEKKILYFFYKNLEKINFFYLNFNYNKIIHIIILLFDIIIKIKIKNKFIINELISILLKNIYPIIPFLSYRIWSALYKKNINFIINSCRNKIYKINFKKKIYKYIIFLNNKKKFIFIYNKKKINFEIILNILFFKKKYFFKKIIKKIIFNKNIINIIFFNF